MDEAQRHLRHTSQVINLLAQGLYEVILNESKH